MSTLREPVVAALLALFSGLLFGAGLAVSGMADPARVRGFLDLFGHWDPTLAFVMGGAMLPMSIAWVVRKRWERPAFARQFDLPTSTTLDRKLALGAVIFGIGWGIAGLCPGPALAALALVPKTAVVFVLAMFFGMLLHRWQPTRVEIPPVAVPPINRLNPGVSVTAQLHPEHIAAIAKLGFRAILCNRPDSEEAGQPPAQVIAQAAKAVGLAFAYVPTPSINPDASAVAAMTKALAELPTPVLAYCRTGARARKLTELSSSP